MTIIDFFQSNQDVHLVEAAIMTTVWVLIGQNLLVSRYRRRAGIKYPQMYAEKAEAERSKDAYLLNCAQSAYHNTLENIPLIWATTIIAGTKMPVLAASVCALWSLARVSYTMGYVSGDPHNRYSSLHGFGMLGSSGLALTATFQVVCWLWEGFSRNLIN